MPPNMPAKKKLKVKVSAPVKKKKKTTTPDLSDDGDADDAASIISNRTPTPPPRSPTPPPQAEEQQQKKERKKSLVLSEEQELSVSEWLREHPYLYTKTMMLYKDTAKKVRLWDMKAEELGVCNGPQLRTWYESVRTRVGKVSDKKSGSARVELTERDTFIMLNFGFLSSHISRMRGRTACSVSIVTVIISHACTYL